MPTFSDFPAIIVILLVFSALSFYIVLSVYMTLKNKQQYALKINTLKHSYEQILLKSQLEIQEETLRGVSQEIHDNIGQVLSLVKLQLGSAPADASEADKQEIIEQSRQLVGKAITDLRALSKSLHPDRVNELGLLENIRHELERLEKTKMYHTRFRINGSPQTIPIETQTILFRMTQESISNIIKHAGADTVEITMDYEPQQLYLSILDNGIGINHLDHNSPQTGIGLRNMKSRSAAIGATFSIETAVEKGTLVKISMPLGQVVGSL